MDDNSIMSFGKHKGKKLANIPAEYFMWLKHQPNVSSDILEYIEDNMDVFLLELRQKSEEFEY